MSSTGLIRQTWQQLWRHPGVFNLVFWSLMVTVLVDWALAARLAPLLPPALANPTVWSSPAALSHALGLISPSVSWRFILFGLAVLLIVTPFRAAGLYGGAWAILQRPSPVASPLEFFGAARRLFWRGLTATLLGVLLGVAALLVVSLLIAWASGVGLVISVAIGLWALVLAWIGLGTLMAEPDRPAWSVVGEVLRTALRRWWDCLRFGLLMAGLILASALLVEVLAPLPLLGTLVAIAFVGILTAFLAFIPSILYETVKS